MLKAIYSARLKVFRTSEHIKAIEQQIRRYIRRKPYEIITDANGKETLNVKDAPPDEIALLVGEALYQLRSALDHLAFDLVKHNPSGAALPPKWDKKCFFPLLCDLPKGIAKPPVPYQHFADTLPNITKAAFAFIESVQPYYRAGTAEILGWLAHLSNIDKHRHLNVTLTNLLHREVVRTAAGRISVSRSGLKHGAEIQPRVPSQPYPIVNVQRRFTAYITFDEPTIGEASRLEVQHVLHLCLEQVKALIIPAFDQFLE